MLRRVFNTTAARYRHSATSDSMFSIGGSRGGAKSPMKKVAPTTWPGVAGRQAHTKAIHCHAMLNA